MNDVPAFAARLVWQTPLARRWLPGYFDVPPDEVPALPTQPGSFLPPPGGATGADRGTDGPAIEPGGDRQSRKNK